VARSEGDIIEDRRHEELVVRILEHHAYRAADLRHGLSGQQGVTDPDFAAVGGQAAVQVEEQSRFAGAVRADDADRSRR
ncbi:MAG: hypothetical protein H6Q56_1407, partial [Deltaproteobacteria bacterium]|nr:hypothetical protein [Deltaproteobacteria bacterium]